MATCSNVRPEPYKGRLQNTFQMYQNAERKRQEEAAVAAAVWQRIKDSPQGRQIMTIKSFKGCQTWGMFDLLIAEAGVRRLTDVQSALSIADLALTVTEEMDNANSLSQYLLFSLRAEAYTVIGNLHRIREEFPAAVRSLDTAEECLSMGTGDIVLEATYSSLRGSLQRDLGDHEGAEKLVRSAIHLLREAEELQDEARNWVKLSTIHRYTDPNSGINSAKHALRLLRDTKEDPLFAYAEFALIDCMVEAGYGPGAASEFKRHRENLYNLLPSSKRSHVKFLAGRIAAALGYYDEAIAVYYEVIEDYRARKLFQEMSLAQLYLVWLLMEKKKWRIALRLCEEAMRHLQALNLSKHALTVWLTVRDLLTAREIETQSAKAVIFSMHRHWKVDPQTRMKILEANS
jgi:tetratricopeptide (TPR) repeat protein